jgi:hypothetical protein
MTSIMRVPVRQPLASLVATAAFVVILLALQGLLTVVADVAAQVASGLGTQVQCFTVTIGAGPVGGVQSVTLPASLRMGVTW